jgi:hypothetical protein
MTKDQSNPYVTDSRWSWKTRSSVAGVRSQEHVRSAEEVILAGSMFDDLSNQDLAVAVITNAFPAPQGGSPRLIADAVANATREPVAAGER